MQVYPRGCRKGSNVQDFEDVEAKLTKAGETVGRTLDLCPQGNQVCVDWPFKHMAPGDVFWLKTHADHGRARRIRSKADTARRLAERNGAQFARAREGAVLTYTRVG